MTPADRQKLRDLLGKLTTAFWRNDGALVCPAYLDGETVYVQSWRPVAEAASTDYARFIAAANPAAVLALLDEVDAANASHENAVAHMQAVCAERDRLKEENVQFLATMMHIMNEVDGNLREIARDLINYGVSTSPESPANPNDIYTYCDTVERLIAGALPKEQP